MVVNNIDPTISYLRHLGLSEYEAKVYLALLGDNPATAYEVGRSSGVPTSKIYNVLERLAEKGIISIIDERKTAQYIPLPPQELLERYKNMTEKILTSLRIKFSDFTGKQALSYIWNIMDYDYLIHKTLQSIRNASQTILLSIWKEELKQIEKELFDAHKKDIKIVMVHFGQPMIKIGQMYIHPIEDTIYKEKGRRGLITIVDSREVLMATIFSLNRVEGAWSSNSGFVTIIEDYIKHDIYIMKIVRRFDRLLKERFGESYSTLRDIFNDREVT